MTRASAPFVTPWPAALALALAGCASLDPAADVAAVRADVAARLALGVPASSEGLDAALAPEVAALLQAPLTDAAAVRIALLHNRDVRAGYESLGIARSDLVQAGLLRNPVFDLDARFLSGGGTDLEAGFAQGFLDLFSRPLRQRRAAHELEAARHALTQDLVRLAFEVRRALVQVTAAQQLVAVQREALAVAEAGHALMRDLHAAGNVADAALARERVGESRARLDLAAAEQAAAEAREPLNALLGLWGEDTAWTVDASLGEEPAADTDLDDLESRAVAASLTLRRHRARLDALAQTAGLASWQGWLAEAEVGVSAARETGGHWGLGPRVALELPVFDRGQARHARAAAELRRELQWYGQLAVEVRATARLLRARLRAFADRAQFLRETHLPARAAAVHTTLQAYNAMQIGVFDVLRQQQQQLADRREYLTTLRAAHGARLDLLELLAGGAPAREPLWPELSGSPAAAGGEGH